MKIFSDTYAKQNFRNASKMENNNHLVINLDKIFLEKKEKLNSSLPHILCITGNRKIMLPTPQKLNSLPVYQHRFTNFNSDQTEHGLAIPGYASLEEFFASQPYDEKASQTYRHKNPKQEVAELIQLKQKEILYKIEMSYQEIKIKMECLRDKKIKRTLAQEFFHKMTSWIKGQNGLLAQGNKIIQLFERAFDQIKYNKENRWVTPGTWSEWSQQDWKGYWKKILLSLAKEGVRMNGQKAIQELSKEIYQKVISTFRDLKQMSK